MQLQIDPEFKALIPPLSAEERAELRASLQVEGCRDKLIAWGDVIIDGHNRYELCSELGIPFEVDRREFADRDAAMLWMIRNQFARRNLTDAARIRLANAQEGVIARQAKERMLSGKSNPSPISDEGRTDQKAAELAGVGKEKYRQGVEVIKSAPEPIQKKWDANEITTNRAYRMTKALENVDPEIIDVVARHNVDEPDTVEDLKRLKASNGKPGSNGTWDGIVHSGYIQPGDEEDAVHISDSPSKIRTALAKLSGSHAAVANHQLINASDNNEWYTPPQYIASVRAVLGEIDVDPASNEIANRTIKAKQIYTIDQNGFGLDWSGKVFMNPPYGRDGGESNQSQWSKELIRQYHASIVTEAIMLVNAVPGNKWFAPLWEFPICFVDHRIRFYSADGEVGQPTHSNVFVYMGPYAERFHREFAQHGPIAIAYGGDLWQRLANS